jgi:FLVCR family MFS transporter 7
VSQNSQFTVLMTGQVICSLANTFGFLVTTKFAQSWFTESQRALANSIALSSSVFGLLIGSFISPLIVNSDKNYVSELSNLNIIFCSFSFLPAILAAFITRSTPPKPPYVHSSSPVEEESRNFCEKTRIYLQEIKKIFKSKQFVFLLIAFSVGLGIFNAVLTLIQQMFCVRGYSNDDVGMFGGLIIGKINCVL